jgi:hypothetical protein
MLLSGHQNAGSKSWYKDSNWETEFW